jgi:hypothetical protein
MEGVRIIASHGVKKWLANGGIAAGPLLPVHSGAFREDKSNGRKWKKAETTRRPRRQTHTGQPGCFFASTVSGEGLAPARDSRHCPQRAASPPTWFALGLLIMSCYPFVAETLLLHMKSGFHDDPQNFPHETPFMLLGASAAYFSFTALLGSLFVLWQSMPAVSAGVHVHTTPLAPSRTQPPALHRAFPTFFNYQHYPSILQPAAFAVASSCRALRNSNMLDVRPATTAG